MRKLLIGGVALAAITSAPAAHADPTSGANYKIVVNGKDITQYAVMMAGHYNFNGSTTLVCQGNSNETLSAGTVDIVWVEPGKVTKVDLSDGTTNWLYFPADRPVFNRFGQQIGGPLPGDAQFVLNGKTYQVTGHISPSNSYNKSAAGPPVPFEFDATCP
jgi:hypothetical protein